ncbi:unnamed protein product [Rhizoctonia solani]|uniref:Uncharacterized protein n=1 Tax=Rhizoctonia solani TaxID=456999 RepID=A0A8H3DGE1_9AGAM|nr:unnamed protein product [Rhizoctonia solani]
MQDLVAEIQAATSGRQVPAPPHPSASNAPPIPPQWTQGIQSASIRPAEVTLMAPPHNVPQGLGAALGSQPTLNLPQIPFEVTSVPQVVNVHAPNKSLAPPLVPPTQPTAHAAGDWPQGAQAPALLLDTQAASVEPLDVATTPLQVAIQHDCGIVDDPIYPSAPPSNNPRQHTSSRWDSPSNSQQARTIGSPHQAIKVASVHPCNPGLFHLPGQHSPNVRSSGSSSSSISFRVRDSTFPATGLASALSQSTPAHIRGNRDIEMVDASAAHILSVAPTSRALMPQPLIPLNPSTQPQVLKRRRAHSDSEDQTRCIADSQSHAPESGASKLQPNQGNKRVKAGDIVNGKHKKRAPCPSDESESKYGSDDEDEDAKTIASVYEQAGTENTSDLIRVLKVLEDIASKLDKALGNRPTAHPTQADGAATQPTSTSMLPDQSLQVTNRNRAIRRRENLRPWNKDSQTTLDTRSTDPQRREKERLALQGYIRLLLMKALGRSHRTSRLPPGPPPEVIEPTFKEFYIMWDQLVGHEFNQAACATITQQLIIDWPALFNMHDWDELFRMVQAHVKYLIKAYKRQEMGRESDAEHVRLLQAAATRREHTTFQQRMSVVKEVAELNDHKRLLVDLGIDGTSSDEEDSERPGYYNVKKIKQLSSQVQELKELLDNTYESLHKGPVVRGSRTRKRIRGKLVSQRKFRIQGLPVNCLNRKWYKKLTKTQKSYFKFAPYEYDFKFPEELTNM